MVIATIAEFLKPSLWVVLMYARKIWRGDSGIKQILVIHLVEATR